MPLTIHILDQTDRGATIKQALIGACGSDDILVEHIQSDCETQPGCDLALVHRTDRDDLREWYDKAKLVVLYTGGNPRADADVLWIQRPLDRADKLSPEEYRSLVAYARDGGDEPDILRRDNSKLISEWRDVLIRFVILVWIFRDSSRASRLSDANRRMLISNCVNKALPKPPAFDKSNVENVDKLCMLLDKLGNDFYVPVDSKDSAALFEGKAGDLQDTARKLLGALR